MSAAPTCPVCDKSVEERESNETFPFCSRRCKRVDLSRWFGEDYSIPLTPHATERKLVGDAERDDDE